jgi:SPP1 gp7 family putative phage head morphogenesis protein
VDQQKLFKQIDDTEDDLLARWDSWLDRAFKTIPWREMERVKRVGGPKALSGLPDLISIDAGHLANLLADHAVEMLAAGQAHGQILVDELHRNYRGRNLADLPGFDFKFSDNPWLIPEKAIKAMEARSIVLAGDVDGDLTASIKKIMVRFMTESTREETEEAVQELLSSSKSRARLITTTETTYAYNRGRLASFAQNRVDHVKFSAIMDARTSPICRSRHGLIMRLDDPALARNTPPLHGRCRSVLTPIFSAYQGDLITPEKLDWSKARPLPKGWNTAA